ncbi:MAG: FG-GAP-like repeat-containing protein, partial [candidate division KSB1 bacterium]
KREQALRTLEVSLQKNPKHVRTLYRLARYYTDTQEAKALQQAEAHLSVVVDNLPANVAAYLELVELLLKNGKPAVALQHMESLRQLLPELPKGSQEILQASIALMQSGQAAEAATPAHMFHNLLKPTPLYQAALAEVLGASGAMSGEPLRRFINESALHAQRRNEIPEALRFTEVTATSGMNLAASESASALEDDPAFVLAHGDYDGDGDQDVFVSEWLARENRSRQYLFANDNGVFVDVATDAGIGVRLKERGLGNSPLEGGVAHNADNTPRTPLKGGITSFRSQPASLSHNRRDLSALFADYDNDGYLDLFITNTRGLRLYHNTGNAAFQDLTATSGIKSEDEARTALFADFDLEGDLDLFFATDAAHKLYRNNSDGTFSEIAEESGLGSGAVHGKHAAFADFDDDGDIDLFVANQNGSNQYFDNLRQSFFRETAAQIGLASTGNSGAVAAGDYDNDGYFDLFVASQTGAHALYRNRGEGTFERDVHADSAFVSIQHIAGLDAAFFDADNDGFLDLIIAGATQASRSAGILPASSSQTQNGAFLFYNNGAGKFLNASSLLPELAEDCSQVEVIDLDNDGDLDLLLAGTSSVHVLRNDGGNINNDITVRLAGLRTGSGKNNFFGIGSKVEVKAGDLTQVRVMSSPIAHFGLGERERAEVVRVVWSNGVAQNWLNPERNQTITEDQILKGSCPWLYAWNGARYEFVTDVLWTSALGMPLGIMQAGSLRYAFPNSGQDYLKISGEKLSSKAGKYLLQFTSELWETSFVDRIQVLAVDHPDSVEIFVDEKFTPPPYPALRVYAVAHKRLPVFARDGKGYDLLAKIAHAEGEYISNFALGKYQGLTEPHDLILDLGEAARGDSVFLFLQGWIFPSDASINVNTSQGSGVKATPPSLEVIDEYGNWKTIIASMGFPKGKNKIMVFDLSGKFLTHDYRVRIQINMQIYWDHIFYATEVTSAALRLTALEPESADLHYRGFSKVTRATPYSPHVPNYHTMSTEQKWRDLTGAYTRYGEVAPLLLQSDSKYVIMNAGDEMTLAFDATALPALSPGWKRDFIFYNDGWVKDGDLNTAHGQTVEPLPFQEMKAYPYGAEEAYPKDEEHSLFLKKFNTRTVNAEAFKRLLFKNKTKH